MGRLTDFLGRLNWFAVAAVLLTVAMFVALLDGGVPNHYAVPIGLAAIVSAVLSLRV